MMASALNLATAFAGGLVSFASPCVLPLIPAYLSFITGSSLEELREGAPAARAHLLAHAAAFCLGFSLVFISAGLAVGTIGNSLQGDRVWLARVGGAVSILLGLHMLGVFRWNALLADRRLSLGRNERRTLMASMLVGIGFAAGWSPCIGPVLAGILVMAANQATWQAAALLTAYSLGLALPFLLTALALGTALNLIRRLGRFVRVVELSAGAMLITVGAVLIMGGLTHVSSLFSR
jgi:cytochrome c-type biogenesis protein